MSVLIILSFVGIRVALYIFGGFGIGSYIIAAFAVTGLMLNMITLITHPRGKKQIKPLQDTEDKSLKEKQKRVLGQSLPVM